jgi:hypothetical protein
MFILTSIWKKIDFKKIMKVLQIKPNKWDIKEDLEKSYKLEGLFLWRVHRVTWLLIGS